MQFIYNDGTSAHRGVWHLTDHVERTVHPAKVETQTFEVIDWRHGVRKSQADPNGDYYKPRSNYWGDEYCQRCGKSEEMHPQLPRFGQHEYDEVRYYPIIGRTTVIVDMPEYCSYTARAACGSGKFSGSNIDKANVYRIGHMKKYLNKTLKVVGGVVVDKYYRDGTIPPQPFCGHCLKQIEMKYGTAMQEVAVGIEVVEVDG